MTFRSPAQSWSKKSPCQIAGRERLAQHVVDAADDVRVALELPDHRAGVQVIRAGHPQPLRDHPEATPCFFCRVKVE